MKSVCFLAVFLGVWTVAAETACGSAGTAGSAGNSGSAGKAQFLNDVKVPMRDGMNLAADVYLPSNRTGKVGCWLVFSPYKATAPDVPQGVERAENWGVAAVKADCRGLCHSEGTFDAWNPGLVDDADDLLDWIAAQPWSNGRIVMTGGSYPGNTQLAALKSGNPHLVACAPSVVTFDPYSINFQNGVLIPQFFRAWHSNLAGTNAWERMSRHATRDGYWAERSDLRNLGRSKARAFYQAGWFDMLGVSTFETFAKLPEGSVLRIGPWSHGVDVFDKPDVNYSKRGGRVTEDAEIEFLRSALKGTASVSRDWPGRILMFTMGRNEWRYENAWPLERTVWKNYDFTGGESRRFAHDPAHPVPMKGGRIIGAGGQYDQREVESRPDVLSYTGEALDDELEVTGPVSVSLIVASTAASSDVTVKLVDVCPDGRAMNVLEGISRLSFEPGVRKTVSFPLDVTSYAFLKGHRIRVDVAGSCAPHFAVNPNPARITVFAGSSLRLPTIPSETPKAICRRAAAESMVLLKNAGVLPLRRGEPLSVAYGDASRRFVRGGEGSAAVRVAAEVDFETGLRAAGFPIVSGAETAVFVVTRRTEECYENPRESFTLTAEEKTRLDAVRRSAKRVVVVLNAGGAFGLKELKDDPRVQAIVWTGLPGMEGGHALADVLSGAVNPSGRLAATFAASVADYPSDAGFLESPDYVAYEDDIFVGYRAFETLPGAREKVVYSFGHGLSYSVFRLSAPQVLSERNGWRVSCRVENVGKVAGRHSVLVYSSVAGGRAPHPAIELRAFAKTALLKPGEGEDVSVRVTREDLAFFDDEGATGHRGSIVLDSGLYTLRIGGSVRETTEAGSFRIDRPVVLSTPGFALQPSFLARRLRADGTYATQPVRYPGERRTLVPCALPKESPKEKIPFGRVLAGDVTLDAFLDQMTLDELLSLAYVKKPSKPGVTCSFGAMPEYGVPERFGADGPSGVRSPEPRACIPSSSLLAASFDIALIEEVGRLLGAECRRAGVDVLFAPGLNVQRHPLCGRNFEYFSEDPLLSGKCAAAYVRGVQANGTAATLKHFALNERETARPICSSIASERAIRDVYLKGFEIAVKEGRPAALMTSYNLINGRHAGTIRPLVTGIVRGEWGFDGLAMTDWHTESRLVDELRAGNDVKLSRFADSEAARRGAADQTAWSGLDPAAVREAARRVLRLVMRNRKEGPK